VPEYFHRRFDRKVRVVTTAVLLVYLLGYIGINLLTMGVALKAMLGWEIYTAAIVVAVVCGIYVTAGGQTSVIMTDLMQGVMLLVAGFTLFGLGTSRLGGLGRFWSLLPRGHRLPINYFNRPPEFNFIGVFWQDGVSQSMFAYFLNQGMIMRFLSAKSPREGRKACVFLLLVLQILAALAVSNAGWLGRAMVGAGLLPRDVDPSMVFVLVAEKVCQPGVFGFVMAALTAALMSTADTLLNATSAVTVNDIYRPYVKPGATDKHYLGVARVTSIIAAVVGLASVPIFNSFKSIYAAHGAFTAMMSPPMAAALMMGAFWRRFNTPGALATIVGGAVCIGLSLVYPDVIAPFSFGVERGGEHFHAWAYQRALYGLVCSFALGIVVTMATPPPDSEKIKGLVWGTLDDARRWFKGGDPSMEPGPVVRLSVAELTEDAPRDEPRQHASSGTEAPCYGHVRICPADRERLKAAAGDVVQLAHSNPMYGGLRSVPVRIGEGEAEPGTVGVAADLLAEGNLTGVAQVRVEKII